MDHLLQIETEKATFPHRSDPFLNFLCPFKRVISSCFHTKWLPVSVVGLEKPENKCFKGHKRSTGLSGVFDFSQTHKCNVIACLSFPVSPRLISNAANSQMQTVTSGFDNQTRQSKRMRETLALMS